MATFEETLAHYGILGMKWGVRRSEAQLARARKYKKDPPSEDAKKVKENQKKARKSGTKSLTNKELKDLNTRLNLEKNYSRLDQHESTVAKGRNFVKGTVASGVAVAKFANSPAGKKVAKIVIDNLTTDFSKIVL